MLSIPSEVLLRVRDTERADFERHIQGVGLHPVAQPTAGVAPTLAFVDPDAMGGSDALGRVQRAALAYPRTPVLLVSGPQDRALLASFVEVPTVAGVVGRDTNERDSEIAEALGLVVRGPSFGLARYVGPDAPILSRELASSVEREDLLEAARTFLLDHGIRPRMADLAQNAIEELVTNAVYDAPTDSEGRRLYADVDRRNAVFLQAGSRPRLELAVDGKKIAALMTDPYGSLDVATVRRYLAMGLRGDFSDKPGGAGLGFARVFGLVDRLVVQIVPRVRTEIAFTLEAGSVKRDPSARPTGLLAWGA